MMRNTILIQSSLTKDPTPKNSEKFNNEVPREYIPTREARYAPILHPGAHHCVPFSASFTKKLSSFLQITQD